MTKGVLFSSCRQESPDEGDESSDLPNLLSGKHLNFFPLGRKKGNKFYCFPVKRLGKSCLELSSPSSGDSCRHEGNKTHVVIGITRNYIVVAQEILRREESKGT